MSIASVGLLLIAVAWIIQLIFSLKGKQAIQPLFIVFYMIGVAAMVTADYLATNVLSYFESLTFIAAGIVLIKTLRAKK